MPHHIDQLTQGGQVWLHNLRMLRQVIKTALLVGLVSGCAWMVFQLYCTVEGYFCYLWIVDLWAETKLALLGLFTEEHTIMITYVERTTHRWITLQASTFHTWPGVQKINARVVSELHQWTDCWPQFFWAMGIGMMGTCGFFWYKGHKSQRKTTDKGSGLVGLKVLKKTMQQKKLSATLMLDKLPLARGHDPSHILITGQSGTGKTNCFHKLLTQIRARRERALIIDAEGEFITRYYKEDQDLILNPFDKRSVNWNPWKECVLPPHFKDMAARLVPHNRESREPFWDNASRTIITAALKKYAETPDFPPADFYHMITRNQPDLTEELKDTDAKQVLDHKDFQLATFRQIIEARIDAFQYLAPGGDFTLRQWMQDLSSSSRASSSSSPSSPSSQWLFITVPQDFFHALENLLGCWLDTVVQTLLSDVLHSDVLNNDAGRKNRSSPKCWIILDELPALGKFSKLPSLMARARKRGGCIIAGSQNIHQLTTLYGLSEAKDILDNFGTHVLFRSSEPETLKFLSQSLGEIEESTPVKSISYGAHAVRDGVALNTHKRTRPLITTTDIANLENLEAYIRLPEGLPITKLKMQYEKRPLHHPVFVMKPDVKTKNTVQMTPDVQIKPTQQHGYDKNECDAAVQHTAAHPQDAKIISLEEKEITSLEKKSFKKKIPHNAPHVLERDKTPCKPKEHF